MFIDVAMFPILAKSGVLENVVCQWIDISEMKRAQESLAAERKRLSVTLRVAAFRNFQTPGTLIAELGGNLPIVRLW
ncbi:MAG: hypothetical protein GF398_08805 [Chitinivibrionales bacterium]|nr:hypothetical protein [Chitinivibrionales bacterium]